MVGAIFDRVFYEGNPATTGPGMQTVAFGASNGGVVEFIAPEEGNYIMVDHEFADAQRGAVVTSRCGRRGPAHPEAAEHVALTQAPARSLRQDIVTWSMPARGETARAAAASEAAESICWGCDRLCPADDLRCGNGTIRTPHPAELFGEDWLEWSSQRGTPGDIA